MGALVLGLILQQTQKPQAAKEPAKLECSQQKAYISMQTADIDAWFRTLAAADPAPNRV